MSLQDAVHEMLTTNYHMMKHFLQYIPPDPDAQGGRWRWACNKCSGSGLRWEDVKHTVECPYRRWWDAHLALTTTYEEAIDA